MLRVNAPIMSLGRRAARVLTSHAPMRAFLRRISDAGLLPDPVWRRLPVEGAFTVSLGHGTTFRYRSNHADQIGRALYWKGVTSWEASTTPVFVDLARRSARFLDIGANTGVYALLACAVNPTIRVVAFEPVPKIFEILRENIALNGWEGRCEARSEAVSNLVGRTAFHVPDSELPTSASLHNGGFRGLPGRLIEVPVTTVDSVCVPHDSVDLIKIDVEGFEDKVLEGMPSVLARSKPAIILECNPDGPYQAVQKLLRQVNYHFFELRGEGPAPVAEIIPDPTEMHRNVLCLPEARLAWISGR